MSDSVIMGGHHRLVMDTPAYRLITARLIAPWALQGNHPRGQVLEIGAGTGAMAQHVLDVDPDLHMSVTDLDANMCKIASKNLLRFGARVDVEQADANALPFPDAEFDFVLSFLMLHHTGDWKQTLRETVRVLRPGGRLVGFDILARAPLHHSKRLSTLVRRGELEQFLPSLAARDVQVRYGLSKALVRFVATRE